MRHGFLLISSLGKVYNLDFSTKLYNVTNTKHKLKNILTDNILQPIFCMSLYFHLLPCFFVFLSLCLHITQLLAVVCLCFSFSVCLMISILLSFCLSVYIYDSVCSTAVSLVFACLSVCLYDNVSLSVSMKMSLCLSL